MHIRASYALTLNERWQDAEDTDRFGSFAAALKESYVNGMPRHVAAPDTSVFYPMPYEKFRRMSGKEVMAILRTRNIAVTDAPCEECQFDEEGLAILAPLDRVVDIQGTSVAQLSEHLSLTSMKCRPVCSRSKSQ